MLTLSLLLACQPHDGPPAPTQDVPVETLGQELVGRVTADLGYDPTAVPDPALPGELLADPEVGPYLQGALDVLQAERDAWTLELTAPSTLTRAWETCSGWALEDESSMAGVTLRVYTTTCGDLTFTHTTMASTLSTTVDLRIDGTDDDGLAYDDFVLVNTTAAFDEDRVGTMSFGEQNPPDPGLSWQDTLALEDIGGGLTVGTWMTMGYVNDAVYGDYRPWHQTIITDEPDGSATISVARWSVIRQALVPWLLYTEHADGTCDRITFDDDGNISDTSSC